MQWIVIDSKVFDLSKFADLHPGGANVLYADGVGMSTFLQSTSVHFISLKLDKMRPKSSLVFIDTRSSLNRNTPGSKSAQFMDRRRLSSLLLLGN
jgi:prepilin-type processing-associated H-X9-DG protein